MITKTIQLYRFRELSPIAQDRVLSEYRGEDMFFDGDDIVKTIEAFCKHFNISLINYELGGYCDYIKIDMDNLPTKSALKVSKKWGQSCPLTGLCWDIDILEPLLDPKGKDVQQIVNNCLDAIKQTYSKQWNYWNSKESIKEEIEANEYTFRENGDMESI